MTRAGVNEHGNDSHWSSISDSILVWHENQLWYVDWVFWICTNLLVDAN